jgi:hypothetical protein
VSDTRTQDARRRPALFKQDRGLSSLTKTPTNPFFRSADKSFLRREMFFLRRADFFARRRMVFLRREFSSARRVVVFVRRVDEIVR